ncbi:MAG: hypothetical protein R3190_08340, partial [Thermoanaerobaculia bacterium]|nr:hypothetical protein [Thermoanaerobaculia bacterium]
LMEPRVAPIVFTRQPDPRLRDPAYLTRFEGRYRGEISEEIMTVELSGGTLWAVIGAARYALDPDIDGRFVLREARLVRIGFEEDAAGRVVKAIQYQPDGAYEAVRID